MKITNYIILFFIVALPFFFYLEAKSHYTNEFAQLNRHHKKAMTVAAHDASAMLFTNVNPMYQASYEFYKINPVDPQPAFDTFLQSLALNYQVEDSVSIDLLSRYVPVFGVVDYDGLLLNVYKSFKNDKNETVFERVWLPKIPFSYTDSEGNVVNFTISDDVEVYDAELKEWFSGKKDIVANEVTIPILTDPKFDEIRRTTIVNELQERLAYYINEHNVYVKSIGVTYTFALPLIPEEDWYNTVDDISILAFFQGYPYRMADSEYHEYAFVGTRVDREQTIFAGTVNGEKRFWYESCDFPYTAEEIYPTKKAAAEKGYRELSCLNPG